MSKTKTTIQTFPTLNVKNVTEKIGPFTRKDNADTDIDGLYRVNRDQTNVMMSNGSIQNIFYSYPDLRINWISNAHSGLYEISVQYYKETEESDSDGNPKVEEFDVNCFIDEEDDDEIEELPDEAKNYTALNKLILRVNNQNLDVKFDGIYLKDTAPEDPDINYFKEFDINGDPVNVNFANDPLDFNDEGLCNIMKLLGTYEVEIHYTAHHEGGYMRDYCLYAISNEGSKVNFLVDPEDVSIPLDCIDFKIASATHIWHGTPDTGEKALNQDNFPKDCAYIIDLRAWSRQQDGYHYVQWKHPRRTYYIRPN
jgi:hypothetical protein